MPETSTETAASHGKEPGADARTWVGLWVLALPILLLLRDATVLVFALPEITRDLEPSAAQQLWIMDIYSFLLAGLLVTMGWLGDRIGRKKLLLLGATLFAAASAWGAFASTPEELILARALLGIGGATLMPSTLSMIRAMFQDRAQRRFAIAVWSIMAAAGTAAGPIVGGWLLAHFPWGSVFLLNIPVMVALLALGPFFLPESRNPHAGALDVWSALLSITGMLSLVSGL